MKSNKLYIGVNLDSHGVMVLVEEGFSSLRPIVIPRKLGRIDIVGIADIIQSIRDENHESEIFGVVEMSRKVESDLGSSNIWLDEAVVGIFKFLKIPMVKVLPASWRAPLEYNYGNVDFHSSTGQEEYDLEVKLWNSRIASEVLPIPYLDELMEHYSGGTCNELIKTLLMVNHVIGEKKTFADLQSSII